MQKVMDEYAGGIRTAYKMNEAGLSMADNYLQRIVSDLPRMKAGDLHELMNAHEVVDRIDVSRVLVAHLRARKESRWPGFQSRTDYPETDSLNWSVFVNSVRDLETGETKIVLRPLDGGLDLKSGHQEDKEVFHGNSN